ncbi:hypothetical protein HYW42_04970 [Candidatus Daviesbacteria bacterium]|nr:hypothetical protein [Candidatus Daviesbacteria bacterium]
MGQKGSVLIWIILISLTFLVVAYFYSKNIFPSNPKEIAQPSPSVQTSKKYSDGLIEFSYPDGFEVIEETEEEFSKRTNTNYRKNFTSYVLYEPAPFIKGLAVKHKDQKLSSQFDDEPLMIWIFENNQNLTAQMWYQKYWYYPFVWGEFSSFEKDKIAPEKQATIAGLIAKFNTVEYRPGSPKFILIPLKDKMLLLKVIDQDQKGSDIVSTLKILN